jgi:hypothetical protein
LSFGIAERSRLNVAFWQILLQKSVVVRREA